MEINCPALSNSINVAFYAGASTAAYLYQSANDCKNFCSEYCYRIIKRVLSISGECLFEKKK